MKKNNEKIEFIKFKPISKPSSDKPKPSTEPFNPLIMVLSFLVIVAIIRMLFLTYAQLTEEYQTPEERFKELITECENKHGSVFITSNKTMICDIGCNRGYYEINDYDESKINDSYNIYYERIMLC